MSLCVKLKPYNRTCGSTNGGIARIWIFDGEDFDFTQAAVGIDGTIAPYTAIALSDDAVAANGALMYPIRFDKKTAEYSYAQSRNGCSVKYAHKLEFQLAEISQLIANWNIAIDKAGCCCGVGLVVQMNSGKILIAGEKYVNGAAINIPLEMQQDGSSGTSGKLLDDPNSQTAIMVGDYNRPLYEYTGTIQSIIDLETA